MFWYLIFADSILIYVYLCVSVSIVSSASSDPLLRDYWVYEGSLTTPPCSENVTWILYRYPLTISQMQVTHQQLLLNIIITQVRV